MFEAIYDKNQKNFDQSVIVFKQESFKICNYTNDSEASYHP